MHFNQLGDLQPSITASSETLFHLVCALNTPNIGALPPQIAFSAVVIAILLFQELPDKRNPS